MSYRIVLVSILGALALTACSEDKKNLTLNCADPTIATSVQQQLQQAIGQSARQFAQTDSRQFIDADKIIAAASQLNVSITDANTDGRASKPTCHAQLSITVPPLIWQQTQDNTPILYPQQQLLPLLQGQLGGSSIQMNDNIFSQPVRYVPANNAAAASSPETLTIEAPGMTQLSHILTNALLPYGIKDTLIINGKPYSRAEALKIINNPNATPAAASSPEVAMASASSHSSELASPETNTTQEATLSEQEWQQAESNNRNANSTINQIWRNMDDIVRTELQNEQRQWIKQKESQCNAAAKGDSAEYLRLQCDTRLTNERINYLRGFSVP